MRHLKTQLTTQLKNVYPKVYYENAPDDAVFPYVVYSLGSSYNNRANCIYTLDLDVWDKSTSSKKVDDITKDLIKKLDLTGYIDEEIQYSLYFDRTVDTGSEDKTLKRKTVIFELRYTERS